MKRLFPFAAALAALFLSVAAAAQPTKSAGEWAAEGYQVISLANLDYELDAVEGFIVLRKDIHYLKENGNGGISVNGNTYSKACGQADFGPCKAHCKTYGCVESAADS